jgi:hypothetical protein
MISGPMHAPDYSPNNPRDAGFDLEVVGEIADLVISFVQRVFGFIFRKH